MITKLNFPTHMLIGALVRFILIVYADYHDANFDLPYTDVDYKVFSDAARHVYNGVSPYKRHTYRYSPFLAFMLIPNVFFKDFGKIIFSIFDLFIAWSVKVLVEKHSEGSSKIYLYASMFWLYNPISIAISTRGNADSVPCFLIILSLMFLQTDIVKNISKYAFSGMLLGMAIHLRLYPLVFSFPMYLSLSRDLNKISTFKNFLWKFLPNKNQIVLTLSCVVTLCLLTCSMYYLYGYEFLFETYIYHLFRKDTRHNFSVIFYYSYLTADLIGMDIVKLVIQISELLILFVLSLAFGLEAKTLPFCLFSQAFVLVAYNSVMTSQYFVWFLSLLPLVLHNFDINIIKVCSIVFTWLGSQSLWLFFAYLLEFQGYQTFLFIWVASVMFFCSNAYVLGQLIHTYRPDFVYGKKNKVN